MSSYANLQAALIDGGITANAAKEIANAIANLASPRQTAAASTNDPTPNKRLRMVRADDRRLLFTNIDQPADTPYKQSNSSTRGRFADRTHQHSYENSQPLAITPSINKDLIKAGPGIKVDTEVDDGQLIPTVSLDVSGATGFLRKVAGTQTLQPVELVFDPQAKGFLDIEQEDTPGKTRYVVKLKNLQQITVSLGGGGTQEIYAFVSPT